MDVLDRADLPFPHSLPEFQRLFPDDAACAAYLEKARWGDGFACPHCGTAGEPFHFENRPGVLRCRKCRQNTGLTVGTVMERSHTPLNVWFWAAYLVASQTPGMSAVQFQRQLGLSRYETAFQILHKLRSGMVRPNQDRIGGRRWPETYRVLALKGAEVVLLGYNTPANMPWEPIYSDLTAFHNHLCMQAGTYQNGAWVVGVAKAGIEEGLRPDRWLHHRRAVGRDRRSGRHQRGRADRRPLRSGPLRARTGRHVQFRRPSADRALQDHHRTDGGHPAGIGQGRTRLRPPGRPDNSPYHGSQIQIDTPIGRW